MVEQRCTCSLRKTPHQGRWMPEEAVNPWGSHAGAGSWQDLGPSGGPMLEQFVPEGTTLLQFTKNCSLWEGPVVENFMEECLLCEGLYVGAGEECEELSS
ncbi:hypothetical protein DUI87_12765 [Hirundo rustica rustica]|uniref:Uncharacterized protein n=1 Tax=Hirundo rustica rustica TaxID=333673 RepID=A0A3M0KA83_HIRRU|nr:hypothetical protein DUI87_12765 [Hirundo rustica rustica]